MDLCSASPDSSHHLSPVFCLMMVCKSMMLMVLFLCKPFVCEGPSCHIMHYETVYCNTILTVYTLNSSIKCRLGSLGSLDIDSYIITCTFPCDLQSHVSLNVRVIQYIMHMYAQCWWQPESIADNTQSLACSKSLPQVPIAINNFSSHQLIMCMMFSQHKY